MDVTPLPDSERERRFNDVVAAYLEKVEAGQAPDQREWLTGHPDLAEELLEFLAAQDEVEQLVAPMRQAVRAAATVSQSSEVTPRPDSLEAEVRSFGDYELLEKIGQGGMGVVYRAQQKSPKRLVALKLLQGERPAAETQRFRNEAQTVAELDHPHIVPLFEVGEHAGHLYFSMKLIEGGSLAEHLPRRGVSFQPAMDADAAGNRGASFQPAMDADSNDRLETCPTITDPRAAARLLAEIARAVHHAHQRGILHRDLKPSNILLDDKGRPHVTDFGLAKRVAVDSSLTQSGQLVGTPSYMAPEQAAGTKVPLTTAADVYGLGAILYALLTGRPPFRGETVLDTLQQVKESEPDRPRSINPRVARDLETICLKCLEKNPGRRYGSAEALAEDLDSFLNGDPLQARPINRLVKLGRWCRRHKPLVLGLSMPLLTVLLLGAANLWWQERQRAVTEQAVAEDLQKADIFQKQDRWPQALQALERARGRLEGSGRGALEARVEKLRGEVALVALLEDAHLQTLAHPYDVEFVSAGANRAYAAAFAQHGLDVEALTAEQSARRIRTFAIHRQLVTALDYWARIRERLRKGDGEPLRAIAWLADEDPWRRRLRDSRVANDRMALERLGQEEDVLAQPPATLVLLGRLLDSAKAGAARVRLLRGAQKRYPADFWINFDLALQLGEEPETVAEAIGFYRAALALRPESAAVYNNLAGVLRKHKMFSDAVEAYTKAIELKRDFAGAHDALGALLCDHMGDYDRAVRAFREAIRLRPDFAKFHFDLGVALGKSNKGLPNDAIEAYRRAIDLKHDYGEAYENLGIALRAQQKLPEAVAAHLKAIELKPDSAAYHNLGAALYDQQKLPEAAAAFEKAIALKPDYALAYNGLGATLRAQRKLPEAEAAHRKAVALKPDFADAYSELGALLCDDKRDYDGAVRAFREAIRLKPDHAMFHFNLGIALKNQRTLPDAEAALRKAFELNPDHAEAIYNIGITLHYQNKPPEAAAAFRKAIELQPDHAEAHCNLGQALLDQGRFADGLASRKRGHELGSQKPNWSYPSGLWVRQAEELVELDAKLLKVVSGEAMPSTAAEGVALARFSQERCKQLYKTAARLYSKVFASEPKLANDLRTANRYNAACAAALAGCGQGKDAANLEASDYARLRGQALAWLRADLTAWIRVLEKEPDKARPEVARKMRHWQHDSDFDGVRGAAGVHGAAALAKLPEAERQEWQKLWQDVEALGQQAAASADIDKKKTDGR